MVMWGGERGKFKTLQSGSPAQHRGVFMGPSLSIRPSGGGGGQAERCADCTLTRPGPFSLAHTAHTGPWVWWGNGQGWAPLPVQSPPPPSRGPAGSSGSLPAVISSETVHPFQGEAWEF